LSTRAIPLHVPPDGYRHTATLPEIEGGMQQDVDYRIVAGDAMSSEYHIHVVAAPTIVIESVDYKYPAYTGLEAATIKNRGDLKAVEGTDVTLHAVANQPIHSATIDFNCDGKPDRSMTLDGQKASIKFTLSLNEARTHALYDSYQLRLVNSQNMENPQPVRHQIEVIPDLPPEVTFLTPQQEEVSLPLDGQLVMELRAIDPDFALNGVVLRAKTERGKLLDQAFVDQCAACRPVCWQVSIRGRCGWRSRKAMWSATRPWRWTTKRHRRMKRPRRNVEFALSRRRIRTAVHSQTIWRRTSRRISGTMRSRTNSATAVARKMPIRRIRTRKIETSPSAKISQIKPTISQRSAGSESAAERRRLRSGQSESEG